MWIFYDDNIRVRKVKLFELTGWKCHSLKKIILNLLRVTFYSLLLLLFTCYLLYVTYYFF